MLVALLAIGLAIVGDLLMRFGVSEEPDEVQLGAMTADAAATVYVQPLAIDPVNYSMQIRVDVRRSQPGTSDLILTIISPRQVGQLHISADQAAPEMTLALDLDGGSVRGYPLDAYISQISFLCTDGVEAAPSQPLPIHVTVWSGFFGYHVHSETAAAAAPGTVVRFSVYRTGAVRFFGLAVFGIMIVLAACSLLIGTLVFLGIRRIEVTLVGALGAIIFALPVLRNAVPGTPPLGIQADVLVFFWAEFGAVMGLAMFVAAWAFRGAQP